MRSKHVKGEHVHCRLDEQLKERTQTLEENNALFAKLQIFEEARKKTEEHCAGQVGRSTPPMTG